MATIIHYTHSLRNLVSKKSKVQSKSNWAKTTKAADKYNKAKAAYKTAKKENKQAIKNQTEKLNKQASFGEKLMYNNATRKRAAQYVVNKNMSVSEATKKAKGDAWKNTAALIGTYAAVGVGVAVYNKNH